jgi:hypothetical protein
MFSGISTNVARAASSAFGRFPISWGPVVGGLDGFVRLDDTGGGVERDAGVCMPLSLGEVEADEESLFVDDESSWVTCVSSFGILWGTGEVGLAMSLSDTPWSGFRVTRVSSADIAGVD